MHKPNLLPFLEVPSSSHDSVGSISNDSFVWCVFRSPLFRPDGHFILEGQTDALVRMNILPFGNPIVDIPNSNRTSIDSCKEAMLPG